MIAIYKSVQPHTMTVFQLNLEEVVYLILNHEFSEFPTATNRDESQLTSNSRTRAFLLETSQNSASSQNDIWPDFSLIILHFPSACPPAKYETGSSGGSNKFLRIRPLRYRKSD
jgi:hypothetical protein